MSKLVNKKTDLIWDTHIHLTQYPKEKIPYYIERWQRNGIDGIIAVATDLKSSYQLLDWKSKYPDFLHIAIGYHPEQRIPSELDLEELLNLIHYEKNQIIGIGEVGLIYYRKKELNVSDTKPYEELLHQFSLIAKSLNKPIILHAVHEDTAEALRILKETGVTKAHFHWFKSDQTTIKQVEEQGYYISFTPEITFRERDQEIAKLFNLSQILLETDGPWPLEGKYSNLIPEPLWIKDSIGELSQIKEINEEAITKILYENTKRLYF